MEDTILKSVADSHTSQVHIIMPQHINGYGRLFGGQLIAWIDVVAGVVARRHSNHEVTTACIDNLQFKSAAHKNSTVILDGKITYVGNTSMEVRVDTFVESILGERKLVNIAYLVMIALDENEHPVTVPRLKVLTDEERKEFEAGARRSELRKKRKEENF